MTPFILYVFASFGFAFVLGYSKISLPLRSWLATYEKQTQLPWGDKWIDNPKVLRALVRWLLALLECPACVGFWLGLGSILTPIVDFVPISVSPYLLAPFLGLTNLGACLALGMFVGLIKTE